MKKYTFEEKIERLNTGWQLVKKGIKIIRETFPKDSGVELWLIRLEAANNNLHREILRKLKQKIFEE